MVLAYSLDQAEVIQNIFFIFLYLVRFRRSSRRKVRKTRRNNNNNNKKKKNRAKKKSSGNLLKRAQKKFERDPRTKNFFASETLRLSKSKKSRTEVRDLIIRKKKPGKKKKSSGNLLKRAQKNFERDPRKKFFCERNPAAIRKQKITN